MLNIYIFFNKYTVHAHTYIEGTFPGFSLSPFDKTNRINEYLSDNEKNKNSV